MRRSYQVAVAATATAVIGVTGFRVAARRRAARPEHSGRRHVVTVYRPIDEVRANLPEVLNDHRGEVAVDLRPAPGGRGTEISVQSPHATVSDDDLRRALREGRSLLEAGEVLRPGGPTTQPTPLNKPLRAVTRRGREKGLL